MVQPAHFWVDKTVLVAGATGFLGGWSNTHVSFSYILRSRDLGSAGVTAVF